MPTIDECCYGKEPAATELLRLKAARDVLIKYTPLQREAANAIRALRKDLAAARADAERWQRIVTEIADDDGCSCSTARLIDAALAGEKSNG